MKVIFLTVQEDPDMISLCFQAGALGYVIKSRLASDLIPAIRLASTNHTFVSPTLPRLDG
jgi:DNA-binding NarL/FixJ family response regulator